MKHEDELRDAIAAALAVEEKAYALREACVQLGLADGTDEEAWAGKIRYVESRLKDIPLQLLLTIGDAVLKNYEGYKVHAFRLKEALRLARVNGRRKITEITRRNILDEVALLGDPAGKLELDTFLRKLWPIDDMASHDPRFNTLGREIWKHMIANDDWTPAYLFDRLNAMSLSDEAFGELLELMVHPSVRQGEEQRNWVAVINRHLQNDGRLLQETDSISGYPVFQLRTSDPGVSDAPRNLIFASAGPKPEIVLVDAIHNELRVVRNGEFCLFFDNPIPTTGLLWRDLVAWWARLHELDADDRETERTFYRRLEESLKSSPPEQLLFRTFYASFKGMAARLPALIPQVYVHYDPKTMRELYGEKRLTRQRMDFLLLLDHGRRVVIEVDGAQHYSENGRPSTTLYAEMVEADRQLKLCGYEVYRFGGGELQGERGKDAVRSFFDRLFEKYDIK